MPENGVEVGMFAFFAIGAFGGWMYIAATIYEVFASWRYTRNQIRAYDAWEASLESEPATQRDRQTTNLTGRNK